MTVRLQPLLWTGALSLILGGPPAAAQPASHPLDPLSAPY